MTFIKVEHLTTLEEVQQTFQMDENAFACVL